MTKQTGTSDTFYLLLEKWLTSYFAESGKSSFQMRLNFFQMRERAAKQFFVVSLSLFSLTSALIIGTKTSILSLGNINTFQYTILGLVVLLCAGILTYSIYIFFKNLKKIRNIIEFHISYAETMTGRIVRNIVVPMSDPSIGTKGQGDSLEAIQEFMGLYKKEESEYLSGIKSGEEAIHKYEMIQSILLSLNSLVYIIALVLTLVFTRG